jgi:AcrR family transcriptional regulator
MQIGRADESGSGLSRRERERLRHREEILAAASELFARQGYERTSMQQIAERAEFSVGKLYQHFDGKETIYRELMQQHCEALLGNMEAVVDPERPPLENLRRMLLAALQHGDRNRHYHTIYINENPLNCEGLVQETVQTAMSRVRELLEQAIARGEIPAEDPELLAAMMVGAVDRVLDVMAARGGESSTLVPDLVDRLILEPLEARARRERPRQTGPEGGEREVTR